MRLSLLIIAAASLVVSTQASAIAYGSHGRQHFLAKRDVQPAQDLPMPLPTFSPEDASKDGHVFELGSPVPATPGRVTLPDASPDQAPGPATPLSPKEAKKAEKARRKREKKELRAQRKEERARERAARKAGPPPAQDADPNAPPQHLGKRQRIKAAIGRAWKRHPGMIVGSVVAPLSLIVVIPIASITAPFSIPVAAIIGTGLSVGSGAAAGYTTHAWYKSKATQDGSGPLPPSVYTPAQIPGPLPPAPA